MNRQRIFVIAAGLSLSFLLACAIIPIRKKGPLVEYPEDYRKWDHIKSMVIQEGNPLYDSFGGIHHIYANGKALKAMKRGKPFPNGSVFVFDLLEARKKDDSLVEGPRKLLGVMERDIRRFAKTGGWGFEAFAGDTTQRVVKDPETQCFSCHESQSDHWYVFSTYRQ